MKINRKYPYKDYTRTTDQGRRVYLNGQEKLPSVTTILSRTKEESEGIKKWRERVGAAEARRIMKEAAQRGSEMHEALEGYLYGQKFQAPTHDAPIALKMANLIISKGLIYLDEIWGVEQTLIYPGSYAGASDLIGLYKQTPTILDFKQANKPKREEWIEDYYLQLAAYICAHEKEYGEIKKGQILVAVKNLTFQEFEISGNRLLEYKDKWWKRVDQFRTSLEQPLRESSPTT